MLRNPNPDYLPIHHLDEFLPPVSGWTIFGGLIFSRNSCDRFNNICLYSLTRDRQSDRNSAPQWSSLLYVITDPNNYLFRYKNPKHGSGNSSNYFCSV
ncbi:hypothetical protein PL9214640123 [Planktothrix tepida PCC 9214]|uniref:Uncharacterized protein n=1 Tax=Planktothrix tepida PCC 9214 TaxID=671072 RepID=A0A1J1LQF1_9CYAN|nr:hypothetical protein [Planktothrix tepida]CUR34100.1 hypothetical protein PL9214640107 [Planktothrix tepida PCC 9214]CUR34116.1 hypothetical protein PL9214640123 [Planktothrix tepida PCC 9214]